MDHSRSTLIGMVVQFHAIRGCSSAYGIQEFKGTMVGHQDLFGVQSRVEEGYLRQIFQQTCKGNSKMNEYLKLMKTHSDNLAQAGSPITTRALISQVLLGLDKEYNPIVVGIQGKPSISWLDT